MFRNKMQWAVLAVGMALAVGCGDDEGDSDNEKVVVRVPVGGSSPGPTSPTTTEPLDEEGTDEEPQTPPSNPGTSTPGGNTGGGERPVGSSCSEAAQCQSFACTCRDGRTYKSQYCENYVCMGRAATCESNCEDLGGVL